MSTRLAFWQFLFVIIIGLEVAALHDAYRPEPVTIPATVAQSEQKIRWMVSDYTLTASEKAVLPPPQRHQ